MTIEIVDGIRVIKMRDVVNSASDRTADMLSVAHIWLLLGGQHSARDTTIYSRNIF